MRNLLFILFIFFQLSIMAQDKPKVIYFGDPMCSWCYGFSPEFSKVKEEFSGNIDFQYIMGGLRPYGTQKINSISAFLKDHWEHVNKASGQPFNFDILTEPDYTYDTEPACRAVITMRLLNPDVEFEFFKAVQTAFYFDNNKMNQTETYLALVEEFGVEKATFQSKFESQELKELARRDFENAAEFGISGFPSIVLQIGEKYHLIANGYMKAEVIIKRINKRL